MDFGDELPCGGYQNEDKKIEQEIKDIVEGKEKKECEKEACDNCECKVEEKKEEVVKNEPSGRICKKDKCNGKAVLLHKGEPICQACLFKNIEYKTRLLLENSFKVTKNSNLLICFSGGLSSICLVSIIVNIVKRYQKNKLFNKLGCIHIQQQQQLPEGYKEIFMKETGVELDIIRIEEVMREGQKSINAVRDVLKQFANNANTIDLITVFRDRLIADFAQKSNYDFVLKGLNAQSLAAESFCYFAKGLGGNLPGLCVSDQEKSPFYYPLRSHSRKELQYYFYVKKIYCLAIKSNNDNIEEIASSQLDDQIKGFIDTLQQMYSHTAPAIVRTAEKIETNRPNDKECLWCRLPGADELNLCRRCLRVWQSRKKQASLGSFPLEVPL